MRARIERSRDDKSETNGKGWGGGSVEPLCATSLCNQIEIQFSKRTTMRKKKVARSWCPRDIRRIRFSVIDNLDRHFLDERIVLHI